MRSPLPAFLEVKRRPDGRRQVFPCSLLARDEGAVVLHYHLTRLWTVDTVRLEPGDETIAYYWTARPYNVYHWIRPDGITAGFYFNAARDTAFFDDRVEWTDLGLDLLVLPDGQTVWIDEEDVAALPAADREAVRHLRRRLEEDHRQVVAWVAERSGTLRAQVLQPR